MKNQLLRIFAAVACHLIVTLPALAQPCLQVQCPTNKTAQCGTTWTFDTPVVSTCCASGIVTSDGTLTNALITSTGITTNGACPRMDVTQTWTITDGCNNSTNCSQTVTVLGCCSNSCLQVQCASDKTVQCGSAWTFDQPLVSTCCTNQIQTSAGTLTNVLVTAGSIITNGTCPQVTVTETWQITDGCGNSTNCIQNVTVVGCCSNCLQVQCSSDKTVQCGTTWDFDLPVVSTCCPSNIPGTKTNILIVPSSIVTNGACPKVTITESWTIMDGCNNSTNCSQTVTVLGCCPSNCLVVQCPSNKTVQCGTTWTFDAPVATSCCTNLFDPPSGILTNVLITVTATVTNGVCPKVITRTWQIIDGCGDTNTCAQVVTVVDTTPPVLNCPIKPIIVALNTNCDLVIPPISVTATDDCTPPCSLVYSQSPPAGTIIPGTSANVIITVTDLCGNSSSCVVTVTGIPKLPPLVSCPSTMVVTNCKVPCVPVQVTAYCCPLKSIHITQSPPCGTPVGPGMTTVTVTVTDCHGNTVLVTVHLILPVSQSFLTNLVNTGISTGGALLPDGAVDPHYALPTVPGGMPPDYLGNAVAVSDICHPSGSLCAWYNTYTNHTCYEYVPWSLAPDAAYIPTAFSKWIGPNYLSNGCDPSGNFTYTLTFNLPVNLTPSTATISGRWAADDTATMLLNGTPLPLILPGFSTWTPFTIPPGAGFVTGINTLKFIVTNYYQSYTGLRVEFTNAMAGCFPCASPTVNWISQAQSLQAGGTAMFSAGVSGTPPLSYQWTHNNVPIPGATNLSLQISPVGFGDAGAYAIIVSNSCGSTTAATSLIVTSPWWWQWGWWNIQDVARPLGATVGPDLLLSGTDFATNYGITAGSTEDFGLPELGGQLANVMEINPNAGVAIQIPPITAPDSTTDASYTVLMDLFVPDTSLGTPNTLFQSETCCISNLSSSGQDGVGLTLDESNYVHISGSSGGVPFDSISPQPMAADTWNRLALVVDNSPDGSSITMKAVLNGGTIIIVNPCRCCIIPFTASTLNWAGSAPSVLSAPSNGAGPNGVFFVAGIQFHDIALPDDMLAGIGSPDSGPAAGNETSAGPPPVLTATTGDGGVITLSWSGSPYILQESDDLDSGAWANSTLPFTETQGTAGIQTTATTKPAPQAPAKFYRLVFRP